MSDVFVSCALAGEPQAKRIADVLRSLGYHLRRDDELPAHRPYPEIIEERLNCARRRCSHRKCRQRGTDGTSLQMLEPVLGRGGRNIIGLAANDPNLDSIRSDRRFEEMFSAAIERVGIDRRALTPPAVSGQLRS